MHDRLAGGRAFRVKDAMAGKDEDPWRVGVLFSRSGVSGITETESCMPTLLRSCTVKVGAAACAVTSRLCSNVPRLLSIRSG